MANTKKAIEEVTEKEIQRAAYEGVLVVLRSWRAAGW